MYRHAPLPFSSAMPFRPFANASAGDLPTRAISVTVLWPGDRIAQRDSPSAQVEPTRFEHSAAHRVWSRLVKYCERATLLLHPQAVVSCKSAIIKNPRSR